MERERRPSEEERQYDLLMRGEAVEQEYLFGLNPNYMHTVGYLIDKGLVEQVSVMTNGEEVHILRLKDDRKIT